MKQHVIEDLLIHRVSQFKIRLNSPEESEKVQAELFALGFSWGLRGQVVQNEDKHFMYCRIGIVSKIISVEYDNSPASERWFNQTQYQEYTVDDILGDDYIEYFNYRNIYHY